MIREEESKAHTPASDLALTPAPVCVCVCHGWQTTAWDTARSPTTSRSVQHTPTAFMVCCPLPSEEHRWAYGVCLLWEIIALPSHK